jgi:hypothetical protein
MKKIILTLIAVTLAVGLFRSFTAFSYEAKAAAAQPVDQGATQPAMAQTDVAPATVVNAQPAQGYSCGGTCNPATCGCSPSQCTTTSCGGSCGKR